ncbi:MAG: hypothetical protein JNK53_01945 [Phycisphaerae bacterium]|nr:hypothetical protein [Phycisphaerae bacterium]
MATAGLVAVAAGTFHAAYEIPWGAPIILAFFVCVNRLAALRTSAHALRVGWVLGLLMYAPQLAFFWSIFGAAAIGLWLVLACWLGLYLVVQRFALVKLGPIGALLLVPALWMGVEYTRSELYYLRFSWLNAGYLLPGLAWWVGMYGVGFVCMLAAAGTNVLIDRRRWTAAAALAVTATATAALVSPLGSPQVSTTLIRVAGVQLEFPSSDMALRALDRLLVRHPDTQVFVLSEYTFDAGVPQAVRDWCARHRCYLVAGGRDVGPPPGIVFRNTAFVVGPDGKDVLKQAKCVPIQFFSDGLPAEQQALWESPWGKIGVCVCYDLSYTRVTDELVRQGAQAIIVPTMDLESWGARQHALHARVAPTRAAEHRIPIFRLCSSGISQAVDRRGVVTASAPFPGQDAALAATLELGETNGRIPLDRFAAWPSVACLAIVLCWCLVDGWNQRPTRTSNPMR